MKPAFNVKSAHLDALSIQLNDVDIDAVRETLHNQISKYLKFKSLPFILDACQLEDANALPLMIFLAFICIVRVKNHWIAS